MTFLSCAAGYRFIGFTYYVGKAYFGLADSRRV